MPNQILDYIIQEMLNPKIPNSPMITPQQEGNPQFMNNLIRGLSEIPTPLGALDTMASPQVDLGTIPVQFPRQQEQQIPQAPQAPQAPPMPLQMPQTPQIPQEARPTGGGMDLSGLGEFLKRVGIPLGAAVAGTAFPGVLPQAAGLATGYEATTQERERFERENNQKEMERMLENIGEDEVAIIDPNDPNGKPNIIRVPKGARVLRKGGEPITEEQMLSFLSGGVKGKPTSEFSPEDEDLIQQNIQSYGKSREEVIKDLKGKGLL